MTGNLFVFSTEENLEGKIHNILSFNILCSRACKLINITSFSSSSLNIVMLAWDKKRDKI